MPMLDVSDVLLDPDLADTFNVKRRTQVVGTTGRTTEVVTTHSNIVGVVTNASPNDIMRLEDYQSSERYLSIVTQFKLQLPSAGYNADLVTWRGDDYLVKTCEPYPQYGKGFYQAIVASVSMLDQPI